MTRATYRLLSWSTVSPPEALELAIDRPHGIIETLHRDAPTVGRFFVPLPCQLIGGEDCRRHRADNYPELCIANELYFAYWMR